MGYVKRLACKIAVFGGLKLENYGRKLFFLGLTHLIKNGD